MMTAVGAMKFKMIELNGATVFFTLLQLTADH